MEFLKVFFPLLTASLLISCSTSTYKIQSTPSDAEVDLIFKNGSRKNVGKTPVTLAAAETNPNYESFQIEIRKDGFDRQSLFVPASYFSKNLDTHFNLQNNSGMMDPRKTEAALNEVAFAVADIQKDIQTKNFEMAISKLNRMSAQYPSVSTFYSLTGNVHYLEKRLDRALASYKRALSLNPSSSELLKIIEKIEGMSGGPR